MDDRQSESLWLHVIGEAIKGPRKGQRLKFLPSEVTTWNDRFPRHPMTSALVGEKVSGFMGTFSLRERMSEFGLSIGQGRDVSLLRFTMLKRVPVMQLTVAKQEVVAVFDPQAVRATAFSRRRRNRQPSCACTVDAQTLERLFPRRRDYWSAGKRTVIRVPRDEVSITDSTECTLATSATNAKPRPAPCTSGLAFSTR